MVVCALNKVLANFMICNNARLALNWFRALTWIKVNLLYSFATVLVLKLTMKVEFLILKNCHAKFEACFYRQANELVRLCFKSLPSDYRWSLSSFNGPSYTKTGISERKLEQNSSPLMLLVWLYYEDSDVFKKCIFFKPSKFDTWDCEPYGDSNIDEIGISHFEPLW